MHLVKAEAGTPIASVRELRDYFERAGKPAAQWRVGTEQEMIGVFRSTGLAPPYAGDSGIGALLTALTQRGWQPIHEGGNVIGLLRDDAQISIEPGGQFEYAARPVGRAAEFAADFEAYVAEVCPLSKAFDIAWLAVGFRPFGTRDDVTWMPKQRYDIMADYLPTRGRLAADMMKRTATVQVNLDFADGDDALRKLRCVMSVTSILTAIYANSPLVDGQDSGFQSYRAEIWRFTDPDRCGILPFVFEDGDVFERYAEWALDVPMFFVHRGKYIPAGGMTFRQFLTHGFEGTPATIEDWELHLSTLFPDARMKKFIEVRGCDAHTLPMITALGPLCRGLLYSADAMAAATALTAGLAMPQRLELATAVARQGLSAAIPGRPGTTVGDLATDLVAIARRGLTEVGPEDLAYLAPIEEIVSTRRTGADIIRELWNRTGGDIDRVIAELRYPELSRC